MAVTFKEHAFWDFAYGIYGREGVSPALIGFQDRHGMDVNMLFLCLWMGYSGRGVLDEASFRHALQVSANWNPEIVCALRALRIRLRKGVELVPKELSDAVRRQILGIEIDCEHVELLAMAAGIDARENESLPMERRLDDCVGNLQLYFRERGIATKADDKRDILTVLTAVFAEIDRDEIERRCGPLLE